MTRSGPARTNGGGPAHGKHPKKAAERAGKGKKAQAAARRKRLPAEGAAKEKGEEKS